MERYLAPQIEADLARKMVFVSGPRQVGKTTLARSLLAAGRGYFNWDTEEGRRAILAREFVKAPRIALDEIHKYSRWRNFLKGLYDSPSRRFQILVTGSARLDLYRRGGDSLQGRYNHLTLLPLTVAELGLTTQRDLVQLLTLGGFPEPYFSGSEAQARRWSMEYRTRVSREDIRDLERVADLDMVDLLMTRLPDLVGSPLSLNALREDLQVSHRSVAQWIAILERLFALFRLTPFGSPKIQAVKKAQKHYHYDWSLVRDPGARFENFVAVHLLKWVTFDRETQGLDRTLHYARTVRGEEIDFVVAENRAPILAVECKRSRTPDTPFQRLFAARFPKCRVVQVVLEKVEPVRNADGVETISSIDFLRELN